MRWLACAWVVGCSFACVKQPAAPPLTGPQTAGYPKLQQLALARYPEGTTWKLADELGSVVLLDVWATWCEPCRDSMPLYQDLKKQYEARGLKVYAINVEADTHELPGFLAETKTTLPILRDPNAVAAEEILKVKLMPTSFLVDRKGTVREVHEGFTDDFLAKYVSEIEALLQETP